MNLCRDTVTWFSVMILGHDTVSWYCIMLLYHDTVSWTFQPITIKTYKEQLKLQLMFVVDGILQTIGTSQSAAYLHSKSGTNRHRQYDLKMILTDLVEIMHAIKEALHYTLSPYIHPFSYIYRQTIVKPSMWGEKDSIAVIRGAVQQHRSTFVFLAFLLSHVSIGAELRREGTAYV